MQIQTRTVEKVTLIIVDGHIDAHTAPHLEESINVIISQQHYQLAADLSQVSYMSSAGLRVLLKTIKQVKPLGGDLVIVAPRENVREVLEVSGFSAIFQIVAQLEDATWP